MPIEREDPPPHAGCKLLLFQLLLLGTIDGRHLLGLVSMNARAHDLTVTLRAISRIRGERRPARRGHDTGEAHEFRPGQPEHGQATPADRTPMRCTVGGPFTSAADPCTTEICAADSFCCDVEWDSVCVSEVSLICHLSCP